MDLKPPDTRHKDLNTEGKSSSVKSPPIWWLFGFLAFAFGLWLTYWKFCAWYIPIGGQSAEWRGQFGDMFGGINALFAAFAFAGLIYTVLLQRHELALQRQELKESRVELARSAAAAEKANTALLEQLKAQQDANMIQLVTHLDQQWDSAELRASRQARCARHGNGSSGLRKEDGPILRYFEQIGLYLGKSVFTADVLWSLYSYRIENYWALSSPDVLEFRRTHNDNSWYNCFESLARQMRAEGLKHGVTSYESKTEEEITRFVAEEMDRLGPTENHEHR